MIRELRVRGFKSLYDETVALGNLTFVVGRNGSGKSNFADVFAFLAEAMVTPLLAVFNARGGIEVVRHRKAPRGHPANLRISVELGNLSGSATATYSFEVAAEKDYGFVVKEEHCEVSQPGGGGELFHREGVKFTSSATGLVPALDPASLALPLVGGDSRFAPVRDALAGMRVYSLEPSKLRDTQKPDVGTSLHRDGGNATSVLDEIKRSSPTDMQRVCDILGTVVPQTTAVRARKLGKELTLQFDQSWGESAPVRFDAFSMSDGTLRIVGLLAAVYQRQTPSLLLIEEPEATIHPGALGSVLDLIRHASRRTQVIVTTHSPDVLDAEWIHDEHLRIAWWENGVTRVTELAEPSKEALRRHLMGAGDLFRANALDPRTDGADAGPNAQLRLVEDAP